MKKCKYCSELIQEEAIKCKHCGEWLNKEENNIFSKAKDFANKKIEEATSNKTKHLFIPSHSEPMVIRDFTFLDDRFVYNKVDILFSDIITIEHKFSQSTLNFVTKTEIHLAFEYQDTISDTLKRIVFISDSENGIIEHSVDRKIKEQFAFLNNYISKLTFSKRVLKYVDELKEKGYFTYKSKYRFHKNGDLEINGNIRSNIKVEYDKDELIWMPSSKGNKSYSFEPYQFIVTNRDVKWFNILDKKTMIDATHDWDIFLALFLTFFREGSFIPKSINS